MGADQQARIINFVLSPLAILASLLRLYDRHERNKMGWDDAWAAASLLFTVLFMVFIELLLSENASHTQRWKLAVDYTGTELFYTVVWTARASILCTIIRISTFRVFRHCLYAVGAFFFVAWAILFAQTFWVCENQPGFKEKPIVQCRLGISVAIVQLVTDILADSLLVAAPSYLISRAKLSRSQKIRLICIFSASIATTVVSINHALWLITRGGAPEVMAAIIETSISLIVANLSVVVGASFRMAKQDVGSSGSSVDNKGLSILRFGNFRRTQAHEMVTIDINVTTDIIVENERAPMETAKAVTFDIPGKGSGKQMSDSDSVIIDFSV